MKFALNPYSGNTFSEFLLNFFHRIFLFATGRLSFENVTTDEIQVFVLIFISLSSALIGTFLVLRKATMLANSLSHTILLGIVITFLLFKALSLKNDGGYTIDIKLIMIAALLSALLTTFFTELLNKGMRLQKDVSIGLIFTTFFALGIILVTIFTKSAHVGTEAIMGNVDALHIHDLKLVISLFIFNILCVLFFYKRLELSTFDPTLAHMCGISIGFFNYLIMILTAATAIGAFRAVGVFLFLAFLVAPPLSARFFTHRLKFVLLLSCIMGVGVSLISVALSRHILSVYRAPLSTAGIAVVIIGVVFILSVGANSFKKVYLER